MMNNDARIGKPIRPMADFPQCGEPERDYAVEARMILQGLTGLLVEKRHLEALEEYYECKLIRIANELEALKHKALG
jgi:hypothetical protein